MSTPASRSSDIEAPVRTAAEMQDRGLSWIRHAPERRALVRVVGVVLLTRLGLYLVAACATRILPAGFEPRVEGYLGKNLSLATWVRWDAWWYLSVVERGYWFEPGGKSNVAFFPMFPGLIKAVAALIGNPVAAGLLVANLAAVGGVLALWAWVRSEAGPEAAERSVLWLCVYPFSFFFHTIYAESLFFLVATLALMAARRRRYLVAGVWGAVAGATRPMGALLALALAWGLWTEWRGGRRPAARDLLGAVLPVLGLVAYMAFLWAAVGDPLAFRTAHAVGWGVRFHWALPGYWRETYWILSRVTHVQGYTQLLDLTRVGLPVVFMALAIQAYRRLGSAAGIFAALATLVAVFFAPESVGRELLAATPAFAAAGLSGPRGRLGEALRLFSLSLLFIFLFAFVTGHFVG